MTKKEFAKHLSEVVELKAKYDQPQSDYDKLKGALEWIAKGQPGINCQLIAKECLDGLTINEKPTFRDSFPEDDFKQPLNE